MKKDIEWLRHKLKHLGELDNHMLNQCEPSSGDELYFEGSLAATERALDFLDELDSQEVLSKDLPVIPAWFDEWWKYTVKGAGNLFHNIERFHDELFSSGTREAYNYISVPENKIKLLNIIINELDYVVEEEQLYFALIKGHELMVDEVIWDWRYWNLSTSDGVVFPSDRISQDSRFLTKMSKEDWSKCGINDTNADFIEIGDD